MRFHFWGVRGSLPAPMSSIQLRNKITAIVQRITPQDLESEDARESFIQNLPEWLASTVGGNTACVELETDDRRTFLLDAGSGLREFGRFSATENHEFHLFISHFHWDHIQGIPFCGPLYNPKNTLHIYSPWPASLKILEKQMSFPYFPTKMSALTPNLHFHLIKDGHSLRIGDTEVSCQKMPHPGSSYSYAFSENGKKFVYATDVELTLLDRKSEAKVMRHFAKADALVLDAQYTIEELYNKPNWGHSNCCHGMEFAQKCGVKNLYLFHHEPTYGDREIHNILQTARWYAESIDKSGISIFAASEGMDVEL